jgi:isopentenyl-diphosphate delta-isomerase
VFKGLDNMETGSVKEIFDRKEEHISICSNAQVEFTHKSTWLEYLELVHQSLPLLSESEIDTSIDFLGKKLDAPFIIGAMTGGCKNSRSINRELAIIAQANKIGFALGSQRAMLFDNEMKMTYWVRDVAPDVVLLANIGIAQAANMNVEKVVSLIEEVDADGMCIHLNTAMEYAQKGGDKKIGNVKDVIKELACVLGPRLIIKETGCGVSREVAQMLCSWGVQAIDISGSGGTSWIRVENIRCGAEDSCECDFENWGIPTAASIVEVASVHVKLIASGGIRSGLDLAKSIALGADLGSSSLPVLKILSSNGPSATERNIKRILNGLRLAMLLTNSKDLNDLKRSQKVFFGPLLEWYKQRVKEA